MRRAALVLLLLVAACSREDSQSIGYAVGPGPIPGAPAGRFVDVAVVPQERTLLVMTTGSGSCPDVPVAMTATSSTELRVEVEGYYSGVCTADAGPTTTLVRLPADVDPAAPLTVVVEQEGAAPARFTARAVAALPTGTRPVR
jgi:hypothetical protein